MTIVLNKMDEQNIDENSSGINISDVIEVIETDPAFGSMDSSRRVKADLGAGGAPYVQILEQPASKALRFRYECEGRSAGSIPGVSSTPENKTFPTIQIVGYKGRAVVVVSCVTKDAPYKPHPHNLVGKEGCKKGVCTVEINNDNMIASFANLGIQCVKKKDIEDALKIREDIRVDPFRTGFAHKTQASSIDLNSVRLCFQAFLEGPQRGKFTIPLQPVVSEPIYDKKAMADLVICKLSHCSGSVAGGNEIILLCEKVAKEDISVRFFEEKNGQVVWEGYGDFTPTQVHKQVAIAFRTPRYRTLEIDQPVKALIQLRRPSDNATSEALPFQITPLDSDPAVIKRKRQKYSNDNEIVRHLQDSDLMNPRIPDSAALHHTIKREPSMSPNPYMRFGGGSLMTTPQALQSSRTPSPLEYPASIDSGGGSGVGGIIFNPMVPAAVHQSRLSQNVVYPSGPNLFQSYSHSVPPETQNRSTTELLDMDTQQYSVELSLNSKELADLGVLDGNLSANLSANLSLNDGAPKNESNMTDSLTSLATSTLNELLYPNNQ